MGENVLLRPDARAGGAAGASEDDEAVPIRMAEALVYCPRQAWYRFVAQDDPINVHMQRGLDRHAVFGEQRTSGGSARDAPSVTGETAPVTPESGDKPGGLETADSADSVDSATEPRVWRHLAVRAPQLGVMGVLDEVTVTPEQLTITEYKTTRLKKLVYEGVLMQLGVQHLALREHAASGAWHGPLLPERTILRVYYTDSRRAQEVAWSDALALRARAVVARCREVLGQSLPPEGLVGRRCDDCQHEPICLPFALPMLREAVQ